MLTSLVRALLQVTKVLGLFQAGQNPSASLRMQYPHGANVQMGGGQGRTVEHLYNGHPPCPKGAGGLEPLMSTLCGPYLLSSPRGGVGGGENI